MRCLVLGGGGFMGSHLADSLLSAGHSVRIFEKKGRSTGDIAHILDRIEWHEGDFSNPLDIKTAVEGMDAVFHLISTTLPKGSNQSPVFDILTNVVPTVGLIEAAHEAGVKKIVFASSGGTVYGTPINNPISESHPTNPSCSYGIHKLTIEKYLALYNSLYGLDYAVLRISNPFGERQNPKGMLGAATVFLYRTLKGEQIEIWGDGSVVRDFLHISDVSEAFICALNYKGPEHVFNIGHGQGLSLNELLKVIEEVTGIKPKVRYTEGRTFDVQRNVLDISLARRELGWAPRLSIRDGLARTAAYLKK